MISRRALAHGLGMKPPSLGRADRRGEGPGRPIHVSATHVVYREEDVAAWLRARGLEWADGTVRPIEKKNARLQAGTLEGNEHAQHST